MNVILFSFVLGTILYILLSIYMYVRSKRDLFDDYVLTFTDRSIIYCMVVIVTFVVVISLYESNKTYYEGEKYNIIEDEFVSYRKLPHVIYDMNGKVEMEPIEGCEIKYIEGESYVQFMNSKWLFLENKRDSMTLNLKKKKRID